jgi:hypothetical protein
MNNIKKIINRNSQLGELKREKVTGTPDEIVKRTMSKMRELAIRDSTHPMIVNIAKEIKDSCNGCIIESAYDIVVKLIKYVSDPVNEEYVRAPIHALNEGQGDCDDMSTALASILLAKKIPVCFKAIAWRRYEFTHVYCLAYAKKMQKWIVCDPVIKKFGKEKTGIKRELILKV